MNKALHIALAILLPISSLKAEDSLQDYATDTEQIYRPSPGQTDGGYSKTSKSMLLWGFLLIVGIALGAAYAHQSTAKTTTTK